MISIAAFERGVRVVRWTLASMIALTAGAGVAVRIARATDDTSSIQSVDSPSVATVGDVVLTREDLDRAVRRRTGGRGQEPPAAVRALAMSDLVDEALLGAELERRAIAASDREIEDRLAGLTQELATKKSSLDAFLTDQGLDRASLRRRLAFDVALSKLAVSLVTPEALRQAYETHHRDLDGTRLRVAHIILRPDGSVAADGAAVLVARATAIRDSIVAGERTFAEAAARHSSGPSRHRGGDLGFIPRHGLLAEEFSRQCFMLEKGEVSSPIVTPFGVHLVTVLEVDAGSGAPEQFRPQLERLAAQDGIRRILEECRGRTPVKLAPGIEVPERR